MRMSPFARKRTCAVQNEISAMGQERTSLASYSVRVALSVSISEQKSPAVSNFLSIFPKGFGRIHGSIECQTNLVDCTTEADTYPILAESQLIGWHSIIATCQQYFLDFTRNWINPPDGRRRSERSINRRLHFFASRLHHFSIVGPTLSSSALLFGS